MKEHKSKGNDVKKMPEMIFIVDESLERYKGPEFEPPKLKEVQKRLSKGIIIHR